MEQRFASAGYYEYAWVIAPGTPWRHSGGARCLVHGVSVESI